MTAAAPTAPARRGLRAAWPPAAARRRAPSTTASRQPGVRSATRLPPTSPAVPASGAGAGAAAASCWRGTRAPRRLAKRRPGTAAARRPAAPRTPACRVVSGARWCGCGLPGTRLQVRREQVRAPCMHVLLRRPHVLCMRVRVGDGGCEALWWLLAQRVRAHQRCRGRSSSRTRPPPAAARRRLPAPAAAAHASAPLLGGLCCCYGGWLPSCCSVAAAACCYTTLLLRNAAAQLCCCCFKKWPCYVGPPGLEIGVIDKRWGSAEVLVAEKVLPTDTTSNDPAPFFGSAGATHSPHCSLHNLRSLSRSAAHPNAPSSSGSCCCYLGVGRSRASCCSKAAAM